MEKHNWGGSQLNLLISRLIQNELENSLTNIGPLDSLPNLRIASSLK